MNIKNSVLSDKDDESAVKKFLNGRSVVYYRITLEGCLSTLE